MTEYDEWVLALEYLSEGLTFATHEQTRYHIRQALQHELLAREGDRSPPPIVPASVEREKE